MKARRHLRRHQQQLQGRSLRLAQRREQNRSALLGIRVGIGQLDDSRRLRRLAQPVVQQRIVGLGGERVISRQRGVVGKVQQRNRRPGKLLIVGDGEGRNVFRPGR